MAKSLYLNNDCVKRYLIKYWNYGRFCSVCVRATNAKEAVRELEYYLCHSIILEEIYEVPDE